MAGPPGWSLWHCARRKPEHPSEFTSPSSLMVICTNTTVCPVPYGNNLSLGHSPPGSRSSCQAVGKYLLNERMGHLDLVVKREEQAYQRERPFFVNFKVNLVGQRMKRQPTGPPLTDLLEYFTCSLDPADRSSRCPEATIQQCPGATDFED